MFSSGNKNSSFNNGKGTGKVHRKRMSLTESVVYIQRAYRAVLEKRSEKVIHTENVA